MRVVCDWLAITLCSSVFLVRFHRHAHTEAKLLASFRIVFMALLTYWAKQHQVGVRDWLTWHAPLPRLEAADSIFLPHAIPANGLFRFHLDLVCFIVSFHFISCYTAGICLGTCPWCSHWCSEYRVFYRTLESSREGLELNFGKVLNRSIFSPWIKIIPNHFL